MEVGLGFPRVSKHELLVAIGLNLVCGLAIALYLWKFGWSLEDIQGASDIVGFVGLFLLLTPYSVLELVMILYERFKKREREEGRLEGRKEERQEKLDQLHHEFAGDKATMDRIDKIFNGY